MENYIIIAAIILFFCLITISRTPRGKGIIGEFLVKLIIGKTKEGKKYVINNYMIMDEGKSSQIDHIVINKNGIFVIETKNYSGRIYGNEKQQEWTQVLNYGKVKNKLYNPIKQNATHVYRIKKILPQNIEIKSIVVFVQNNTRYIEAPNVYPIYALSSEINKAYATQLTIEQMQECYKILLEKRANEISNREHVAEIKKMKEDISNNICPRCGGKLVERQGKYGSFYGCENYPNCKFIKKQ